MLQPNRTYSDFFLKLICISHFANAAILSGTILLVSCGKLDKDSNCLNDKAACFKADKTRPQINKPIYPVQGALISQLPYVDLLFSEELNNPQAADFVVSGAGGIGLSVISVEKIAEYTYRLTMNQSAVSNGLIVISFVNLKDYAGNIITGVTDVTYQGNVDIAIRLTATPTVLTGISNTAGGYNQAGFNVSFTHGFVDDDGNAWSACITTGAITCPLGSGFANGTGLASLDKAVSPGTAVALSRTPTQFSLGQNRLVIYVENTSKNRKGVNSWPIFRDDSAPSSAVTPPGDAYSTARQVTLICTDNADKIIYTSASQQSSAPAAPADPGYDASGNPVAPAMAYSGPITTPATPDPLYTTYKWLCIDKGGNKETTVKTATYIIDSSLPDVVVNLDSTYHDFVSTGGYTSTTLRFTTNQSPPTQYRIAYNTTGCNVADGTDLVSWQVLPVTAGNLIQHTYNTTTHFTADTVYNVRICVKTVSNALGFAYLPITRDSVRPATTVLPAGGSFGAPQAVTLTCSDNVDKVAYTTDGSIPSFFANGQINVGLLSTGPINVADGVTTIKYLCRDKAGNEELAVGTQTYTIDSVLPTVTILSNTYAALSNTGPQTSTTLAWTSSRPSSSYKVHVGGSDCASGTQIATGTTDAITSNATSTPVTEANLGADGTYTVRICVANLINNYGNTTVTLKRDTVAPTLPIQTPTIAQIDATNYLVSWNASSDNNAILGYRIYRGTAPSNYPGFPNSPDYTAVSTSATIAMPDTNPYILKIVPFDIAGNVPAAGASYTEITTKPTIRIVVAGLASGTLPLTDGTTSNAVPNGTTDPWTTSLAAGSTYNFSITTQPAGQVCGIRQSQFGALTANITINIDCIAGYMVGGRYQALRATPLNFMLYRGKTTTTYTAANAINGIAAIGSTLYFVRRENATDSSIQKCNPSNCSGTLVTVVNQTGSVFRHLATDGVNLYTTKADGAASTMRIYKYSATDTAQAAPLAELNPGLTAGYPSGLTLDVSRQLLYVGMRNVAEIKRVSLASGVVATITSGVSEHEGMALLGDDLYVATPDNGNCILKVTNAHTATATAVFAGSCGATEGFIDGPLLTARFARAHGISSDGTDLYVSEFAGRRIRRINVRKGIVSTLAGGAAGTADGTGPIASFGTLFAMTTEGRSIYVSEGGSTQIRRIVDNGLVGYWPIDPGVNPNDYSSDGTAVTNGSVVGGGLGTMTDRFGIANLASTLNGTSQYVSIPDSNQLDLTNEYSLSAWVYPTTVGTHRIIDKIVPSTITGYMVDIVGGRYRFIHGNATAGAGELLTNVTAVANIWTHIAATYSSTQNKIRFYVNGHLAGEQTPSIPGATPTNVVPLRIGADNGGAVGNFFQGSIADTRIYNRALNEGEINELAQDASSSPAITGPGFNTGATGLLSHYALTGATATDAGALNYLLTTMNGLNTSGIDGDVSGARFFNGSSDYLGTGASPGLPNLTAPRTICAWVNPASYPGSAMLASYGAPTNDQAFGLIMYGASQIGLTAWNNDVLATTTIPLNSWTHVCGAFNGSTATIYRNGLAMTTGAFTGSLSTVSGNIVIGKNTGASGAGYFPGKIDDVRIYNNALTATQIRQLATQVPVGLVARLDFAGDTSDVSGFGNTFSATGSPSGTTDRYMHANQAFSFSSGAKLGTSSLVMNALDNLTLSAWVRPRSYQGTPHYVILNGSGGDGYGLFIDGTSGNVLKGILGGIGYFDTTIVPPLNVWTHVAMVRSGTTWSIYVNGVSVPLSGLAVTTAPTLSTNSSYIALDSGSTNFITGDFDDARFYARALSAAELRALAGYHPMQVTSWSATPASSSLKFFLQPEVTTYSAGGCSGGVNCVSAWNDSSGNAFNVAQATGNYQPIYDPVGINSKPAVKFVQASKTFLSGACAPALNSSNNSIFAVFNEGNQSGNNGIFQNGAPLAGKLLYFISPAGRTPALFDLAYNAGAGRLNLRANANFNSSSETVLMALDFDGAAGNLYKSENTVASTSLASASYNCGTGTLDIGRYYWGPVPAQNPLNADNFDGFLGDFIYFNQVLGAVDRNIVQCYLSARYSIPLASGTICP